ncbi:hypothetical protein Tco_1167802 [Tanacetum coccineum]
MRRSFSSHEDQLSRKLELHIDYLIAAGILVPSQITNLRKDGCFGISREVPGDGHLQQRERDTLQVRTNQPENEVYYRESMIEGARTDESPVLSVIDSTDQKRE